MKLQAIKTQKTKTTQKSVTPPAPVVEQKAIVVATPAPTKVAAVKPQSFTIIKKKPPPVA